MDTHISGACHLVRTFLFFDVVFLYRFLSSLGSWSDVRTFFMSHADLSGHARPVTRPRSRNVYDSLEVFTLHFSLSGVVSARVLLRYVEIVWNTVLL
jgi:hypothetical protein